MKQVQLNYLYRDAGNYKLYGTMVFSNVTSLSLEIIRQQLESKLIDGVYFVPEAWGIERLEFPKFDAEEDHSWHELESIVPCEIAAKSSQDIVGLIRILGN